MNNSSDSAFGFDRTRRRPTGQEAPAPAVQGDYRARRGPAAPRGRQRRLFRHPPEGAGRPPGRAMSVRRGGWHPQLATFASALHRCKNQRRRRGPCAAARSAKRGPPEKTAQAIVAFACRHQGPVRQKWRGLPVELEHDGFVGISRTHHAPWNHDLLCARMG